MVLIKKVVCNHYIKMFTQMWYTDLLALANTVLTQLRWTDLVVLIKGELVYNSFHSFEMHSSKLTAASTPSLICTDLLVLIRGCLQVICDGDGGRGGGFFLTCKDLGGTLKKTFPAYTSFFFLLFFYLRSACVHQFSLFRPESVRSGSASWDDCGQAFPDKLGVRLFPW